MKRVSRNFLVGLIISMSIGFSLGLILWFEGIKNYATLWFAIGFGLFFLRMKWLKNVNQDKNGAKIRGIV